MLFNFAHGDIFMVGTYIGFGIATGRRLDSAMEMIEELGLPKPDVIDTDAGTQLHYGDSLTPDRSWRKAIGFAWQPDEIRRVLDELPGFYLQDDTHQSEFKVSYEIDPKKSPSITTIKKLLREAGAPATAPWPWPIRWNTTGCS